MDSKWISFDDEAPQGQEYVILFHKGHFLDPEFPGLSIMESNADYARANAKKDGYTHWCRIPYPLPVNEQEISMK